MTKHLLLAAGTALVTALAIAPMAKADTIDFSTFFPNQVGSADGVTFTLAGGPGPGGTPSAASFGEPALGNSPTGEYPTSSDLIFTFSTPVDDLSFVFDNFGDNNSFGEPSVYSAFDGATEVDSGNIGSVNFATVDVSGSEITELDLNNGTGGGSSWEFGVFSISFTDAPVPEPASLALFGMGLAALGLYRRRKAA